MKKLLVAALSTLSINAFADGFNCQTETGDLSVKVYNQTQASQGTRNSAVMIFADPSVQQGRRTIARFNAGKTLDNRSATYTARGDLRYNDSGRGGEYILGTRLAQVAEITVDVDFSYAQPMNDGEETTAVLTLVKRDGSEIGADLVCTRYLKN